LIADRLVHHPNTNLMVKPSMIRLFRIRSSRRFRFLTYFAFATLILVFGICGSESKSAGQELASQAEVRSDVFVPVDLSGNWKGSWLSCKSGHNGKLRATFCRLNDKQVQAVFVGSFAKILPFRYKAVLDIVHEESGMIVVRGSKRLGPFMGTFSYQATITADRFDASYNSKRDWGKWSMSRCCE